MEKHRRASIATSTVIMGMGIALLTSVLNTVVLSSPWGIGILTVLGGCVGWIWAFPLRTMLRSLQEGMDAVGKGDLTYRIGKTTPLRELELLVQQFDNQLAGTLQILLLGMKDILKDQRALIREFQKAAESSRTNTGTAVGGIDALLSRYMDLNDRIEDITGIVQSLHGDVQQVVQQISEQSGAIQQSSASVEQMTASIESVARIATAKQETTQSLLRTSQEGAQKVAAAMTAMNQMAQGIEEIRTIVELINDVAARTNLLAMNAAIEATHAGQYGRGFAVVAGEIRKLAESTASHTKKVGNTLSDFNEKMRYLEEAAQVAFSTINKLNEEVLKFVDAFSEIVRGTQEAASGGRQMLTGVTSLRASAESLRAASESMEGRIVEFHTSIQSLREFAKDSYIRLESLGGELKALEKMEEEISRLGTVSLDHINTLSTELKYFRLENDELRDTNEYSRILKEIILHHKRMVYGARWFVQGRLEWSHLPDPRGKCPLDEWIHALKKDFPDDQDLTRLEVKHREFHQIYENLIHQAGRLAKEDREGLSRSIYPQLESRWKELIVFRDVLDRGMMRLQKKSDVRNI
ncbi:MAG: hypothetical protein Kow009_02790 [Spirochaetales bacterium]